MSDNINDITKKEGDAFGLPDRNYHLHAQEILDGVISLEMETFDKICKELGIGTDELSKRQMFLCYEHIYDAMQITFNATKQMVCEAMEENTMSEI